MIKPDPEATERMRKIHEFYFAKFKTLTNVYEECCHVGCWGIYEDPEGVFWEEVDGPPLKRIEDSFVDRSSPKMVAKMREYGVSEETIKRIVEQVWAKGEES